MTKPARKQRLSAYLDLAVVNRLTTTPALPEPAAQAARAKAGERYDAFGTALGRRLAKGPKLKQEISEEVVPDTAQD